MLATLARTLVLSFTMLVNAIAGAQTTAGGGPQVLPAPTGPFAVGRVTLHLTDATRAEPLALEPRFRELMLDAWYPAETTDGAEAPYLDPAVLAQPDNVRDLGYYLRGATDALSKDRARTHAVQAAPFARGLERAPLLIFSHGGGEMRETYTAQLVDLASHGYVVAAITHTYDAAVAVFPDGRRVLYAASRWPKPTTSSIEGLPPGQEPSRERLRWWADDIRFVLGELTGRDVEAPFAGHLDAARVGALGHSAGGQAAAHACQLDARLRACLNQDGLAARTPYFLDVGGRGMDQPFMVIARAAPTTVPSDEELARMGMTRAQAETLSARLDARRDAAMNNTGGSYWVELDSTVTTHADFGDLPFLQAGNAREAATRAQIIGVVRRYTREFFDATLAGNQPATLVDPPPSPLVRAVRRYPAAAR
jgi:hypothetical protein